MIIALRVLGSLVVLFTMNVTMVLVVDTNPPSRWRVNRLVGLSGLALVALAAIWVR
jgi:hypothetical protein